jgi:NAD(P)H-hydrate epimerase
MLKVLNAAQLRTADAWTIRHEPVSSIDLMERAASACTAWLTNQYGRDTRFRILCGPGNNGGDGLAIARQLYQSGYDVAVERICIGKRFSEDHTTNFDRLHRLIGSDLREVRSIGDLAPFRREEVVVDALLGSGLNKPLDGLFLQVVQMLNGSGAPVVSIDLPSGLPTDEPVSGMTAVAASFTLSFQTPKRTFFFPETGEQAGRWILLDIGVQSPPSDESAFREFLYTRADASEQLGRRKRFAHKGDFGHDLLVAGSYGKLGAALLAARAALRTGSGLLTVHLPGCGLVPMQTAVPEAMVSCSGTADIISDLPADLSRFDAVAIGPGLGTAASTAALLRDLLELCMVPLVLDADALNILAADREALDRLPSGTLLTPHPGEFDRLFGTCQTMSERIERARAFTGRSGCILVLKGGCTAVIRPDGHVHYHSNGNPGMAKGGSGDALTGILLALLGNGLPPESAADLGVHLHAAAGDLAAARYGERGMLPSDLIKALPLVLRELEKEKRY